MAEEKKEAKQIKTFQEIEKEAEEGLNLFFFIVFIPNPLNQSVRLWIDGGDFEFYMHRDRFLAIIEATCGYTESNKIRNACNEYGVPFFYDRDKKELKEINELAPERKMDFNQLYKDTLRERKEAESAKTDMFNAAMEAAKGVNNFGLPNFENKNCRTNQKSKFGNILGKIF